MKAEWTVVRLRAEETDARRAGAGEQDTAAVLAGRLACFKRQYGVEIAYLAGEAVSVDQEVMEEF